MDLHIGTVAHKPNGFTLVELALVMLIVGLLTVAGFRSYDIYRTRQALEHNAHALMTLNAAVNSYFVEHGYFPCPAPISAYSGDPRYGRAMNCAQTAAGDYRLSTRSVDLDGDGTPETLRIREGTFPFADLQEFMMLYDTTGAKSPSGKDVLDAHGRQFTYVVTESQATENGYRDGNGGILLRDEHGRIVANNADFLIISHGENGVGARTSGGSGTPCTGQGRDLENCDGDAEFVHGLRSMAVGNNYYDDQVAFMRWVPADLWKQTPSNPNNIYNINPGFVGIGLQSPTDQLHIMGGDLLAARIWDNNVDFGSVRSDRLCADNGGTCMSSQIIAGDIFPQCGPTQLMIGIAHNAPICVNAFTNYTNNCGTDSYAYGLTYNATTRRITALCRNPRAGR